MSSPQAATIAKVALVGLGDVTHSVDQGQRYVPLAFTKSGTTLTVTGPASGGVAPPGCYMLFVVDSAGVPSVARMVQVGKGPNPLMSPVRTSAGRCADVPGATLAIKAYLQAYACNGTKAQALTRLPGDSSLRVLGNCVDVPSRNFVAGQKVWTYTCNNTPAPDLAVRRRHHDPADREHRAVPHPGAGQPVDRARRMRRQRGSEVDILGIGSIHDPRPSCARSPRWCGWVRSRTPRPSWRCPSRRCRSTSDSLRRELGDQLYNRTAAGLAFTPGGLRLAGRAGELLGLQDRTIVEVGEAARGKRTLRLAASSMFAEYGAPGLIELFASRAADLDVELSVRSATQFSTLLLTRTADIAIGPAPPVPDDAVISKPIMNLQIVLVVGPGHPLAGTSPTPHQLRDQTWLLGPSAAADLGAVPAMLRRMAVPEDRQQIFQSHAAAIEETKRNKGVAPVLSYAVAQDLARKHLVRLTGPQTHLDSVWHAAMLTGPSHPPGRGRAGPLRRHPPRNPGHGPRPRRQRRPLQALHPRHPLELTRAKAPVEPGLHHARFDSAETAQLYSSAVWRPFTTPRPSIDATE